MANLDPLWKGEAEDEKTDTLWQIFSDNSKLSQFCFYNICPQILHLHRAASWFECKERSFMLVWDTTHSLTQLKASFCYSSKTGVKRWDGIWSVAI